MINLYWIGFSKCQSDLEVCCKVTEKLEQTETDAETETDADTDADADSETETDTETDAEAINGTGNEKEDEKPVLNPKADQITGNTPEYIPRCGNHNLVNFRFTQS